jgi:hypothetical protein
MAGRLTPLIFGMLPVLAAGTSLAQSLADPTRPPQDMALPAATATTADGTVPASSGLQSVILRKEGRPAALINGAVVELGSKVGESRLVKVDEDSVVLLGPEGRETLYLMPGIEKKAKVGAGGTAKSIGMHAYKGEKR